MNKQLIIIGASGHGKVCLDIALQMKQWDNIYFIDDYIQEKEILGHKVIGTLDKIEEHKHNSDFFVAIGDLKTRKTIFENLKDNKCNISTLVHPLSIITENVKIGRGSAVMKGSIVNIGSSIGEACIINTAAIVEHDCAISNYVNISPNVTLCGSVTVEEECCFGAGSVVINNIDIAKKTTVGAGSVVVKSINESGIYTGIPAKLLLSDDL